MPRGRKTVQGIRLTADQANELKGVCAEKYGSIEGAARAIRETYDQMKPQTGSRWFGHVLPRYLGGLRVGIVPARAILDALNHDPRISFLQEAAD